MQPKLLAKHLTVQTGHTCPVHTARGRHRRHNARAKDPSSLTEVRLLPAHDPFSAHTLALGQVSLAPSAHCFSRCSSRARSTPWAGTPDPPASAACQAPARKGCPTGLPVVRRSWPSQSLSSCLDSPRATGHIQHPTATMLAQQPKQPRLVLGGAAAGVPDVQLPHTSSLPVSILVGDPFCRHPQGAGTVNAVHHPDLRLAARPRAPHLRTYSPRAGQPHLANGR